MGHKLTRDGFGFSGRALALAEEFLGFSLSSPAPSPASAFRLTWRQGPPPLIHLLSWAPLRAASASRNLNTRLAEKR